MKQVFNFCIIFCLYFLPVMANSQTKSYLIMDDVAIFYPENFNADDHLPSFALVNEPVKIAEMPDDWATKVDFLYNGKLSIAYVDIDETTDIYGTGEVTGPLKRNGLTRILYNQDSPQYYRNQSDLRLYQSHPWVLGVRKDGTAFGVLADSYNFV